MAALSASRSEKTDMVPAGQCIVDYSFEMSAGLNYWFREHIQFKNAYLIYSAFLMDVLMLTFMVLFYFHWNSIRLVFSLILFYPPRQVIQGLFLIARPVGFLRSFPGIHAITIPYFDTNDFYWSGHVGSSSVFMLEYARSGYPKMACYAFFVVVSEWFMLTATRDHYIIDLVTGLMLAQYIHRWGEKLAFVFDVWLLGLPSHKRQTYYYKPCYSCGFNNMNIERYTDQDEIEHEKLEVNLKPHKEHFADYSKESIKDSVVLEEAQQNLMGNQ